MKEKEKPASSQPLSFPRAPPYPSVTIAATPRARVVHRDRHDVLVATCLLRALHWPRPLARGRGRPGHLRHHLVFIFTCDSRRSKRRLHEESFRHRAAASLRPCLRSPTARGSHLSAAEGPGQRRAHAHSLRACPPAPRGPLFPPSTSARPQVSEFIFNHHIRRCKNRLGFRVQVHTSKTVPRVSKNKRPNFSQLNLSDN